MRGTTV